MKPKPRITKFIRYASGVGRHAWYEAKTFMGKTLILKKPIVGGATPLTEEERKLMWHEVEKSMQNLSFLGKLMNIIRKNLCRIGIHRWLPMDSAGNWKCFYCKIEEKRA